MKYIIQTIKIILLVLFIIITSPFWIIFLGWVIWASKDLDCYDIEGDW